MIIPESLKPGDTVAIVSTARKIFKEEINFAINWLTNLGYKVVLGKTIGIEHHQFAGTDTDRATDFQAMLDDNRIKAIWCARGGYGTVRIIDLLDFSEFKKQPKWVIGYSDITVLHSHINNLGIATIHSVMPIDIEKASAEAKKTLENALCGNSLAIEFGACSDNIKGEVEAEAIGGNLSILYSLCGSASSIKTKNKILFIEDLDEYYYHVDRMLQNLLRNGMFDNLAGLVVGGMTSMHDNTIPFGYSIKEMILETTNKFKYPIVFQAPMGHMKDNRAVIFGKKVRLLSETDKVLIEI